MKAIVLFSIFCFTQSIACMLFVLFSFLQVSNVCFTHRIIRPLIFITVIERFRCILFCDLAFWFFIILFLLLLSVLNEVYCLIHYFLLSTSSITSSFELHIRFAFFRNHPHNFYIHIYGNKI